MMTPPFQPGAALCGRFYRHCVRPILKAHFPHLSHAAGLLDSGSEVLGFDDPLSTDHDWGPRLLLFLNEADFQQYAPAVHDTLAQQLPYEFEGYPTNFTPPDAHDQDTQLLAPLTHGPVNHRVVCYTVRGFFLDYLNSDITQPLEPADWLTFAQQRLLTVTAGPVYEDDIRLNEVRARFHYYPHDVWLYLLAAGWTRLSQEAHLMGRAGMVGDEVGSALIAARLVRDIMQLCFLMARRYAPYAKWFGTAFQQLAEANELWPVLQDTLQAATWQAREKFLVQAYEWLAAKHNTLGFTKPLPEQATLFFGRPFQVMAFHGFAEALLQQVRDPRVQRLTTRPLIGSLEQFSDNTDLVSDPSWRPFLRRLYE